jgi:hypothetical protein
MSLTFTQDRDVIASGEYDVALIGERFFNAIICIRNDVTPEDAALLLPPCGTTRGWQPMSEEVAALHPEAAPVTCQQHPDTHTHHIFAC